MASFADQLALGFSAALTFTNLGYCFAGVLLGTMIGVLPGLGPVPTIALLLPITFGLDPISSFIMLAGIFYGAQYGGSTTAILINLPGESSSVITALDGYRMARDGRAGLALATAAIGSFVAGTIATLVIALVAPALASFALLFSSPEYFSLMTLGLVLSVTLASGSVLRSLAMVVTGLLLGAVGTDVNSGVSRFTLGFGELYDGLSFVALAMGLFGISEIILNLQRETTTSRATAPVNRILPSLGDFKRMTPPILRGTLVGCVLGVLPGGGAILSSFAAYALEKRISKNPERFGKGAIEGVAGPESANNAASQTSFIPMLTLGLPSNPVMALMIGALIIHGIQPGPKILIEQPTLFWGLIASMWIGNFFLLLLNLPLIGIWARLITVPYHLLFPLIISLACIGVYAMANTVFDIYLLTIFGFFGYVFAKLRCEPAPLLLSFILGPFLEEHLRRSLLLSRGDPMIFLDRPISATLLAVAAIAIVSLVSGAIRRGRATILQE